MFWKKIVKTGETPALPGRQRRAILCAVLAAPVLLADSLPHVRPEKQDVPGKRISLPLGVLYLRPGLKVRPGIPLVVHFHGAPWVSEWNFWRSGKKAALVSINIGAGSSVYRQPFSDPQQFGRLLESVEQALGQNVGRIVLTSFSAGYGAIREIISQPEWQGRVTAVLLADSLHASYVPEGQPGVLNAAQMAGFLEYAGQPSLQFWVMHSQIIPGTYASTTETAGYLIERVKTRRRPTNRMENGMRLLSRADRGRFHVRGYAGDTAPDHMDHFYSMGQWLKRLKF